MVAGSRRKTARDDRRKGFLSAASAQATGHGMGVPVVSGGQAVVNGRNSMPIGIEQVRTPHPTARRAPVVEPPADPYGGRQVLVAPQIMPEQVIRRPEDPHPPMGEYGYARNSAADEAIVPARAPQPDVEHVLRPQEEPVVAPVVDVTVILYSNGSSMRHLAPQLHALRSQTVRPANIWIHVDGQHGHDERTVALLFSCRTQMMLGRYFRMAFARQAPTRFVAILDEDTIPGARWLEKSLQALVDADPNGQMRYGGAVVTAAGGLLMGDDPGHARAVGPEFPTHDPMLVDFGRQAWVFDASLCHAFDSLPEHKGGGALAFAFAMAAAASAAGVPTVVLDYGQDRREWPAREPSAVVDPFEDIQISYQHYRQVWQPQFVGLAMAAPPAPAPAAQVPPPAQQPMGRHALPTTGYAPQQPSAPAQPMQSASSAPMAPAAAPPLVAPQASMAQGVPRGAVGQAFAGQPPGAPQMSGPMVHPDGRPAGRTPVPPPDAKVTSDGGTTQIEWVPRPEDRHRDESNERVLEDHERQALAAEDRANERVLQPHEQHAIRQGERQPEFVVGHSSPAAQDLVNEGGTAGGTSQP